MEDLPTSVFRMGDFTCEIDLKDAYRTISVNKWSRICLRFLWKRDTILVHMSAFRPKIFSKSFHKRIENPLRLPPSTWRSSADLRRISCHGRSHSQASCEYSLKICLCCQHHSEYSERKMFQERKIRAHIKSQGCSGHLEMDFAPDSTSEIAKRKQLF